MSTDPVFAVVQGRPTDEELAALVTVLALRAVAHAAAPAPEPSGWSAYARTVRAPLAPGPDAWRRSGRPQ